MLILTVRNNWHIRIDRVLIFRTQDARVVLSKVFFLAGGDLTTHDETRTQLDGLRLNVARVGLIIGTGPVTVLLHVAWWANPVTL